MQHRHGTTKTDSTQTQTSSPSLPPTDAALSAVTSSNAGSQTTQLQPLPTGKIAGLSPYWFSAHDGPVLTTAPHVLQLLASKNATVSARPADALARLRAAEISALAAYGARPFVADAGFLLRSPPLVSEVRTAR